MIKLYELNEQMRGLMAVFSEDEAERVLDLATSLMLEIEMRPVRVRLGANRCVEIVLRTILYCDGKGNGCE